MKRKFSEVGSIAFQLRLLVVSFLQWTAHAQRGAQISRESIARALHAGPHACTVGFSRVSRGGK